MVGPGSNGHGIVQMTVSALPDRLLLELTSLKINYVQSLVECQGNTTVAQQHSGGDDEVFYKPNERIGTSIKSAIQYRTRMHQGYGVQLNCSFALYIDLIWFWNHSYTETTLKIRQIGEYCIRKRLTALENNEEVPHDILTLILQTVRESKTLK